MEKTLFSPVRYLFLKSNCNLSENYLQVTTKVLKVYEVAASKVKVTAMVLKVPSNTLKLINSTHPELG